MLTGIGNAFANRVPVSGEIAEQDLQSPSKTMKRPGVRPRKAAPVTLANCASGKILRRARKEIADDAAERSGRQSWSRSRHSF